MIRNRLVHRTADGTRIPGTWRHAFICNGGNYYLTDLFVYADGLVDCWGLVTLDEFAEKLRSGWVATELRDGAQASGHELASWTLSEPHTWHTPELLLAEVRDTVDALNGRPDSTGRCLAAVDAFLADRTEANRAAARAAYLEIPETRRMYALGDMDRKDGPLKALVAGVGAVPPDWYDDEPLSPEDYAEAVAYFEERARWIAERPSRTPADGPEEPYAPSIHVPQSYPLRRSDDPGPKGLRNEYPVPVEVGGAVYPSAAHAYWALSVDDDAVRAAVAQTDSAFDARDAAAAAPRRAGWEHARTAVMTAVLRAKFTQHPALAEALLATGDAALILDDISSAFWGDNAGRGRNWTGRLLELIRAELAAARAGIEILGR